MLVKYIVYYCFIGQKSSTVVSIVKKFRKDNLLKNYTVIICGNCHLKSASMQYIAP